MDLLFKEYASPFLLLDGLILCGEFDSFVPFFVEKAEERKRWDFYVNKIPAWNELTWEDFNRGLDKKTFAPAQKIESEKIPEIINTSRKIISGFREGNVNGSV